MKNNACPVTTEHRARRHEAAGPHHDDGGRHGDQPGPRGREHAAPRWHSARIRVARPAGCQSPDAAAASRPARRRHAGADGAHRTDFRANAFCHPRSGAGEPQTRQPGVNRARHGDRQGPGRQDDGSSAPHGPQRRQPRIGALRRTHGCGQNPGRASADLRIDRSGNRGH